MFATHMPRSLLCWVVKPVTFSILVFAIKRVKKLVMLGGETCDISHSRLHNKTCQELVMLGGETCDISRSGVHKTCKAGYPVGWWNLWHFQFSYSQQNVPRNLLCWVMKPVTFLILIFATKCYKKFVMLGGETCDIFRSCIRNKMCQGACYVRCWNLWHFPFSRNHRIGIGYRDLGLCHSFSHLQSAVSLVEMNPPIRIGIRSPRDRSGSDHRIWSIFLGTDLMASQLAQKSLFLAKKIR